MKKLMFVFLSLLLLAGYAHTQNSLTKQATSFNLPAGLVAEDAFRQKSRLSNCGLDTIYYPVLKLSGNIVNLWGDMAGNGFFSAASQVYELPVGAKVSLMGFAFEGRYLPSGNSADINLNASVYEANLARLPIGNALATTQVVVDTSTRVDLFFANFATPVNLDKDFVLVLENPTDTAFSLASNNIDSLDGKADYLAGQNLLLGSPGWTNGEDIPYQDSLDFNVDWLMYPMISFEFEASFAADRSCLLKDTPISFASTSSSILNSKFFNRWVFDSVYKGGENRTIAWDLTASGAIQVYGPQAQQSYASGGDSLQEVLMRASNFGYTAGGLCSEWKSTVFPSREAADPDFRVFYQGNLTYEFRALPGPANESYAWDFGDGSVDSTGPTIVHTFQTTDTFTVRLTTTNCGTDSSLSKRFLAGTVNQMPFINERFDVYPNPSKGKFALEMDLKEASDLKILVLDLWGRKLLEYELKHAQQVRKMLDLSDQERGVYFLQIDNGEQQVVKKMVLE